MLFGKVGFGAGKGFPLRHLKKIFENLFAFRLVDGERIVISGNILLIVFQGLKNFGIRLAAGFQGIGQFSLFGFIKEIGKLPGNIVSTCYKLVVNPKHPDNAPPSANRRSEADQSFSLTASRFSLSAFSAGGQSLIPLTGTCGLSLKRSKRLSSLKMDLRCFSVSAIFAVFDISSSRIDATRLFYMELPIFEMKKRPVREYRTLCARLSSFR